jgi:type IV pilus assembly protein PilM
MGRDRLVIEESATAPDEPRRNTPILGLLTSGGALLGQTARLAASVGRLKDPLRAALPRLPRQRADEDGTESVEGGDAGHRVVAGARASRSAVAVSFDGATLRVLQHIGPRVVGWASLPLDSGLIWDGEVHDASGLGDALGEAFDRLGLSRRRVAGILPGRMAICALFEVPLVRREAELVEVVAEEASRRLGYSPDESYLFWERIVGQRRGRYVFAAVVPQEPLLRILETLETAGVHLDSLDLQPLALARAVNQRDAVIASLERDGLDVVVVSDDLPVAIRSLPLSPKVSDAAAREVLGAEVARALAGYSGARALLDADARLYLAGSRADESLAAQLARQTGHQVGTLAPPVRYPDDFPLAEQLANVGLALKAR